MHNYVTVNSKDYFFLKIERVFETPEDYNGNSYHGDNSLF